MELDQLIAILTADYARFPQDPTYSIYSPQVYFKDPMYDFTGLERYQKMIGFITRWFANLRLDLHHIEAQPSSSPDDTKITTRWTMSWEAPLPWKPRVAVSGWSELTVSPDRLITAHIDYWDCSRWELIQQHFRLQANNVT
jgi:hypothetical protein